MPQLTGFERETFADLHKRLGRVPLSRIRSKPAPGTATERDLIRINERKLGPICELVDGVLVEKPVGQLESSVAADLLRFLGNFLAASPLGYLTAPDGGMRVLPGVVRVPDISFIAWEQLPSRQRPTDPIAGLSPALAVEVLSPSNTSGEIRRKLREYFVGGTKSAWVIDLKSRTVQVYSAPDQSVTLSESDPLDGGPVLPGFSLPLATLFGPIPPLTKPSKRNPGRKRRPS